MTVSVRVLTVPHSQVMTCFTLTQYGHTARGTDTLLCLSLIVFKSNMKQISGYHLSTLVVWVYGTHEVRTEV